MFVVYQEVDGVKWRIKNVETEAGAKRSVTALRKRVLADLGAGVKYQYMSAEDWVNRPVKMKTVRNLMSGKEVEIPADTPIHCDPSSETYWSM